MSTEITAEAPAAAEAPRQRLGVAHLLLWTAGSAVALAFLRGTFDEGLSGQIQVLQKAMVFVQAPLYGAALACLPLVFWRTATGRRLFPTLPGHWLLLIQGVSMLATVLIGLAMPFSLASADQDIAERVRNLSLRESLRALPTLGVTLIAIFNSPQALWRMVFIFMALGYVLGGLLFGAVVFGFDLNAFIGATQGLWLMQTISAMILLACVIRDRSRRAATDFLHTTGVIVRLAIISLGWIMPWLYYLASRY